MVQSYTVLGNMSFKRNLVASKTVKSPPLGRNFSSREIPPRRKEGAEIVILRSIYSRNIVEP